MMEVIALRSYVVDVESVSTLTFPLTLPIVFLAYRLFLIIDHHRWRPKRKWIIFSYGEFVVVVWIQILYFQ